jgi:hypothetical protein
MQVQAVCGCDPDGRWGSMTVASVQVWQDASGLIPDGKVGPKTLGAIEETWQEIAPPVSVGVWWDLGARWTVERREQLADDIVQAGIESVAIMVDGSKPDEMGRPRWKWSGPRIRKWADCLHERKIDVLLSCWPRPDIEYLTAQAGGMAELIKQARPARLENDLEGNWEARDVSGYESLEHAATALLEWQRVYGLPIEATTFPNHAEFSSKSTVACQVEGRVPQCYSRYIEADRSYDWGAAYGPARMQRHGIKRARGASIDWVEPRTVCGLACYAQTFPDHSPQSAMAGALLAARAQRIEEVRYWSAKFIWGDKANGYARSFIGGIK